MRALLKAASAKSLRAVVMTYPREAWWTKLAVRIWNWVQSLRKDPFRVFVHPVGEMEALLNNEGLRRISTRRWFVWEMALFQRAW
jgi:hypothetical protein